MSVAHHNMIILCMCCGNILKGQILTKYKKTLCVHIHVTLAGLDPFVFHSKRCFVLGIKKTKSHP
jgi:hypothetical protein